jgi:catalase
MLPEAMDFVKDQYRHCKPILALGKGGSAWLDDVGVTAVEDGGVADNGIVINADVALTDSSLSAFLLALGRHRQLDREVMAVC